VDSNPKALPVFVRRLQLLGGLAIGLAVFLLWLPREARAALWAGLMAQRLLLGLLFSLILLALSVLWSVGQRIDTYIFMALNRQRAHSRYMDRLMWLVTQCGTMWAAFILSVVFFALNYRHLAVEIVLGTITLWLIVETIKMLTDRSRPFLVLEGTRIIGRRESGRSFPSGHTSQIFFMAAILSYQFKLDVGSTIILYLVAVIVGFTRIYVGAHYPRDVLGGVMLGSVWGMIMTLIDPYLLFNV
jgi:membrane-associated phospholipid phosphatase